MPKAIYIHIPFCEHICHYCDFNKFFLKGQPVDEYIAALIAEMEYWVQKMPPGQIETIYIGGGTPTALSAKQLEEICLSLHRFFLKQQPIKEWTVEANPGSVTREQLEVLYDYGVNRLSIGAQTFSNELLQTIGRTHQADDVFRTVELARSVGFRNISVDLMFGLPNETVQSFHHSLKQAFSLDVEHFSVYSLKIEEKTVFYQQYRKGNLSLPEEEEEAEMYELLMEEMARYSFGQYEISNFAKKGFESAHNLTYWNNDEYYGLGAGAHGYVNGVRIANIGPVNKYIAQIKEKGEAIIEKHYVTEKEKMEEEMFLGLRKIAGVDRRIFQKRFAKDLLEVYEKQINDLVKKELVIVTEETIRLSKKALLIANDVFEQFLLDS